VGIRFFPRFELQQVFGSLQRAAGAEQKQLGGMAIHLPWLCSSTARSGAAAGRRILCHPAVQVHSDQNCDINYQVKLADDAFEDRKGLCQVRDGVSLERSSIFTLKPMLYGKANAPARQLVGVMNKANKKKEQEERRRKKKKEDT